MVATGEERCTGGRTKGRGVELVVLQPAVGQAIKRRGGNRTSECTCSAITSVIGHDQQDIGRILWRGDILWKVRSGFVRLATDNAAELPLGNREHSRASTRSRDSRRR